MAALTYISENIIYRDFCDGIIDGNRVIAETDGNNNITSKYIYGTGIDEILHRQDGTTTYYYIYDGLGSVCEITDRQGNFVERYDYDAWGNFTIKDNVGRPLTTTSTGNNYYFTGREYDSFTGLYNYRARWYDAKIGRFISADPIGYIAGPNVYAYVSNRPTILVDPLGLYESDVHQDYTTMWALEEGMSKQESDLLGKVDENYDSKYTDAWSNEYGDTHFRGTGEVMLDLEDAIREGNTKKFANLLHQLQDSYSHKGYSRSTGGHIITSVLGKNPDKYVPKSKRDQEMKKMTKQYLKAWKKYRSRSRACKRA